MNLSSRGRPIFLTYHCFDHPDIPPACRDYDDFISIRPCGNRKAVSAGRNGWRTAGNNGIGQSKTSGSKRMGQWQALLLDFVDHADINNTNIIPNLVASHQQGMNSSHHRRFFLLREHLKSLNEKEQLTLSISFEIRDSTSFGIEPAANRACRKTLI